MTIEQNILSIRDRIKSACEKSGRSCDDVTLIAVTKTIDINRIKEAVSCGLNILGENKVQEITEKFPLLYENIEYHMIGHLQTNKVKYIVDKVSMIQSVDSLKLAQEIDMRFRNHGRIIDILVEINIGGEQSKHGLAPEDVYQFLNSINKYKNLNVCGLMTVAPDYKSIEKIRPYFKKMKEIFENIKCHNVENIKMNYLSMGMTNDFEIAVEEGANIIRIGSGIFGPRNY